VLVKYQEDVRNQLYDMALQVAETYESQTQAMLLRMQLIKANLST